MFPTLSSPFRFHFLSFSLSISLKEYEYQRQILLESLREQEKVSLLYETVCRSLLSEKEFKRVTNLKLYVV